MQDVFDLGGVGAGQGEAVGEQVGQSRRGGACSDEGDEPDGEDGPAKAKAQKPRIAGIAADLGLSDIQGFAIYLLDRPLSMGELAQRLVCDNSNVTGIVDRLESRGLIERQPSPDDRRVKLLVLTAEGEKVRRQALARFVEPAPGIASLTVDEQRTLRDLLQKALEVEQGEPADRASQSAG